MSGSPADVLLSSLLDLLWELRDDNVPLILGGGYGVYLKQAEARRLGFRTLLPRLPAARSTNDLDLFLRTEIVADPIRFARIADALRRMGCQPVPGSEFLQFLRTVPLFGRLAEVKYDVLTGPAHPDVDERLIRKDVRRWRPRAGKVPLHAHPTDEAVGLEENLQEVVVHGSRSTGAAYEGPIFLPQPFTFALMKLFAFRDQRDDPAKDFGRHHAVDLFSIIGLMTQDEWKQANDAATRWRGNSVVREAGALVRQLYANRTSPGIVRLREHPLYSSDLAIDDFRAAILDLLGNADPGLKP